MKLKYSLFALSALAFFACEPMEDAYKTIDNEATHTVTKVLDEYVLTDANYISIGKEALKAAREDENANEMEDLNDAYNVEEYKALNNFATADKYVPAIITQMLPSWGKDSYVNVTYNYQSPLVKNTYVTNGEYKAIFGNDLVQYFTPMHSALIELPGVFAVKYPSASSGNMALIQYKTSDAEPTLTEESTSINENFGSCKKEKPIEITGWKQIVVEGKSNWIAKEYDNNLYAQMSANKAEGQVETWLITPAFTVFNADVNLSFGLKYGYYNTNPLSVMVSETYPGDDKIVPSQWVALNITYPGKPSGNFGNWEDVKTTLSAYNGKKISLAFKYAGNDNIDGVADITTTVQIDDILVSDYAINGTVKTESTFYKFDGTLWAPYDGSNVIMLEAADYDAMGTEDGRPGKYDNFDGDKGMMPEDYLPTFIKTKYAYSVAGETVVMKYNYRKNGKTSPFAAQYIYDGTAWVFDKNIQVVEKEAYINNGEKWVYDPTIIQLFSEDDYMILIDWVRSNKSNYIDKTYNTTEYWFGGNANFKNFRVDLIKRRANDPDKVIPANDAEAETYLTKMIAEGIEVMLKKNYSNTPAKDKNGTDQNILIECKVYDGTGDMKYGYTFKVLGDNKYEWNEEVVVTPWAG